MHVRQLLGYERLGQSELLAPINELLAEWSLWKNLFCTTMEQLSATREGSKQKRRHVKVPQTAAQRLLASDQLSATRCRWIEERLETHNPFMMKARIEARLAAVWKTRKRLLEAEAAAVCVASLDVPTLRSGTPKNADHTNQNRKAMVSTL